MSESFESIMTGVFKAAELEVQRARTPAQRKQAEQYLYYLRLNHRSNESSYWRHRYANGWLHVCPVCHKICDQKLKEDACPKCLAWRLRAKEFNRYPYLIVNGTLYYDGGRKPISAKDLGSNGEEFMYQMHDEKGYRKTNNLHDMGPIPRMFEHLFTTNTARFI